MPRRKPRRSSSLAESGDYTTSLLRINKSSEVDAVPESSGPLSYTPDRGHPYSLPQRTAGKPPLAKKTERGASASESLPCSQKKGALYTTDVKAAEDDAAESVKLVIRRRRRIGRPFVASSPLGWNEEYLSSPASPASSATDMGSRDEPGKVGDSSIYIPSLSSESLEPSSLLRRRRGGKSGDSEPTQAPVSFKPRTQVGAENNVQRKNKEAMEFMSFSAFRINYLIVHIAIMLADGLQGTHLYVLYEGYGYSVASLYCLGFLTGAVTSPFIGPFVDKIGRKKAAMLYCSLEMFINWLEQFPYFYGLIVSRMIGGITTNLLFSVFESWLVTEHRRRGYAEEKLETILRDSVILSNLAAIASGFLAEFLAVRFGPVGPFEGAVACTAIALLLVMTMWRENYGSEGSDAPGAKSFREYMTGAFQTIVNDSNISRIGLAQGLSEGSLQTFVFLWSPALARFAANAPSNVIGLDANGEPAYGLIFGSFMACGVMGGVSEPYVRKAVTYLVRGHDRRLGLQRRDTVLLIEGEGEVKPAAVEFMATGVYLVCAGLLMIPYLLPADGPYSFSVSLCAFLLYEFMVGLYMPCEGVIRSIYMPTSSVCSVMTMLRVIVNIAVAAGVISTNYIPFKTAFAAVSTLMMISAAIQLSMVDNVEWSNFVRRVSGGSYKHTDADTKRLSSTLHKIPESDPLPEPIPVSRETSLVNTADFFSIISRVED